MFDEIKIKRAKNGYIIEADDEIHVAKTSYILTETIRDLVDADFTPSAEKKREDKIKKKKL